MQSLTHADLHRIADEVFEDLGTESTAHARRPLALIYAAVTLSRLFHPNEERAKSEKQTVTLFRGRTRAMLSAPILWTSCMSNQAL